MAERSAPEELYALLLAQGRMLEHLFVEVLQDRSESIEDAEAAGSLVRRNLEALVFDEGTDRVAEHVDDRMARVVQRALEVNEEAFERVVAELKELDAPIDITVTGYGQRLADDTPDEDPER